MNYQQLLKTIENKLNNTDLFILAIDGKCGSGKTTLANNLASLFSGVVIHMDDFFLKNGSARLSYGNIDYHRFIEEVINHLNDDLILYNPFSCKGQKLMENRTLNVNKFIIIEGAYSTNPFLNKYYDYSIFTFVSDSYQYQSIINRNGLAKALTFKEKWIPLEEEYFIKTNIKERVDISINLLEK